MLDSIKQIALTVREEMEDKYGYDLTGHCIEASEQIAGRLRKYLDLGAVTVEGWCRFDDEYYGSDRPWDPHTWVEVPSMNLYIDVTADQFNYGMDMENEFPAVLIQENLPHGMQYEEPSWEDFGAQQEEDFMKDTFAHFDICESFKKHANDYGFSVALNHDLDGYVLCAETTDQNFENWISYYPASNKVFIHGNTDNLNIWLSETRKELTPERCQMFVNGLNDIFSFSGQNLIRVCDIIDPEDWQEIAQVQDAHKDVRFTGQSVRSLDDQIKFASSRNLGLCVKGKESEIEI